MQFNLNLFHAAIMSEILYMPLKKTQFIEREKCPNIKLSVKHS